MKHAAGLNLWLNEMATEEEKKKSILETSIDRSPYLEMQVSVKCHLSII